MVISVIGFWRAFLTNTKVYGNKGNLDKTLCFLFSGKAGVGKSYNSRVLLDYLSFLGYKVTAESFATGIKEVASFMGWDGVKDAKGRKLLQAIGQTGRDYDENIWVRSTFGRLEEQIAYPFDAVIIDDCRFKNEISYIENNELLYKIVPIRIEAKFRESLANTPMYNDISEVDLDDFNFKYELHNIDDGSDAVLHDLKIILEAEGIY